MATAPIFASTPIAASGQVSAANANRDGTGTLVTVKTAGASGTKIEQIDIIATGTTTVGVVRLFIYDGTNTRLLSEQLVTAITPSATVEVAKYQLFFDNLIIPATYQLRASTHNAETFNVFAFGGDF